MKIRAILAGTVLGIATLAYAANHQSNVNLVGPPTPLCPPDQGGCSLNQ